ncbi:hypothetical protein JCM3765_003891 [Sporobolomyces pararoseus]
MTTTNNSFDSLLDLESQFYQQGFQSGFPHGELHGLFEGRELGKEKSFELWEEIGYYKGVAQLWKQILNKKGGKLESSSRSIKGLEQILKLSKNFPDSNDSSSLLQQQQQQEDMDITQQLTSLRSKYKTVCATLGIRSRIMSAQTTTTPTTENGSGELKQMGMSL